MATPIENKKTKSATIETIVPASIFLPDSLFPMVLQIELHSITPQLIPPQFDYDLILTSCYINQQGQLFCYLTPMIGLAVIPGRDRLLSLPEILCATGPHPFPVDLHRHRPK
jgi:hypothetical protein